MKNAPIQTLLAGVLLGSFGMAGMAGVFWPELRGLEYSDATFGALIACFAGTCMASFGNIIAARNLRHVAPVRTRSVKRIHRELTT